MDLVRGQHRREARSRPDGSRGPDAQPRGELPRPGDARPARRDAASRRAAAGRELAREALRLHRRDRQGDRQTWGQRDDQPDRLLAQRDGVARGGRRAEAFSRSADSAPAARPDVHARRVDPDTRRCVLTSAARRLAYKYQTFLTIDRAHFTLRLWKDLHLAHSYTIAVGRQGLETPAGLYEINDRQVNPSWHVPNSAWAGDLAGRVIPPGPRRSDQVPVARLLQRRRDPRHRRDLVTRHRGLTRLHPHVDPGRRAAVPTGAAPHADLRRLLGTVPNGDCP